jgi:SH3-like domain-containing protein
MENEKSKKDKQDKKTTEGEARERKEEIKPTERLALDLELTLGRNLCKKPSSLVVSPAESIGSPCRSGASTPGTENLGMVEFMWDEVKCQSVAKKEPKNPEMGQSEDKSTRNGKDKSGAVPKLMLNQLSKLQKISSLTDDSPRKRKVADTSMETDVGINPYKKRESLEVANLKEAMDAVTRIGGKINKVVKNLYHPKTELVDLVAKLNKWAGVFQKESLKAWMEAHKYEPVEKAMIDVDTQADVERETEINKRKATTRNVGCQTDSEDMDGPRERRTKKTEVSTQTGQITREQVWKASTYEEYASIVAEKWEDQCYTVTEIIEGNPLQAERDTDLTVWVKKNDDMEKGLPRMFKERYPELAELEGNRVASIEISVRYGDKEKCTSERVITRMVAEMEERDYFNDLHQLRLAMVRKGRKKVAIPKPDIGGLQRFRRMVECIFGPHGLEVKIYVPRKQESGKPENKQTYKTAAEKARNQNTVLIVNEGNTEYSQLLKKIKDGVIKQGSQKAVKTLRKTKDGSLLIEVEKGEENVKCLEKIIEIETTNGKVKKLGPTGMVVLHIKGMDELATEKDVENALREETRNKLAEHMTVGKLRPSYGGTQAVTVRVHKELALQLLGKKSVKIGLNSCTIQERIDVEICYKCWGYNHKAKDCEQTDKKNLCRKCGEEGHLSKECVNEAYCIKCNKAGHAVGSAQCRHFKEALAKERRARAKKNEKGVSNPSKNEKEAGTSDARQKEVMKERDQNRVASEGEDSRFSVSEAEVGTARNRTQTVQVEGEAEKLSQ